MDTERVVQYECKVCGRRIDVTRAGDVYEEPIYCCGVQSAERGAPAVAPAAASMKKKPTKRKPAKKKPVKKKAVKKKAKKAAKKAKKKPAKKKAVKKKVAKKTAKKKTVKKKKR
jgi:hypothetical protein